MKIIHILAYALLWVGGLNWGLIGLFKYDLIMSLFGSWPVLQQGLYVLIGLAALFTLLTHASYCRLCGTNPA